MTLSKKRGPVAMANEIQRVRTIFKFAVGTELIDKLLGRLGLKTPGRPFYGLRHTFKTIAGNCKDERAIGRASSARAERGFVLGLYSPALAETRFGINELPIAHDPLFVVKSADCKSNRVNNILNRNSFQVP
jgi:hypothetical protein